MAIPTGVKNAFSGLGDDIYTAIATELADFVLLEADSLADIANTLTISAVVANGRLFTRSDLDALLARVVTHAPAR